MYSDFLFCPEGENKKLAEHFGQSHIQVYPPDIVYELL